ncbi:MAG: 4Fe-4S dicluster domain-containing protein [Clostridia bacterium]|nr:4Fe-4S dicluster domain-containing protein [Clostridia bacterium]
MAYPGKITKFAMGHLSKAPATRAFPLGELIITPHFRGKLVLKADDCIGCGLCERDCPAYAIKVENRGTKENKDFHVTLNLAHCIFCCQCMDSCRKGCLSYTPNVQLAGFNKDDLIVDLTEEWKAAQAVSAEEAPAEEAAVDEAKPEE